MFPNQKYLSESPGTHLSEYTYRIKFLPGDNGVIDGFGSIVQTEFTRNRQKKFMTNCVYLLSGFEPAKIHDMQWSWLLSIEDGQSRDGKNSKERRNSEYWALAFQPAGSIADCFIYFGCPICESLPIFGEFPYYKPL